MLISHRHRFIYTKTYKTGGTSVESYFEPFCMAQGEWALSHFRDEYVSGAGVIGFRGTNPPADLRWWNHMPAADIRKQVGDTIWSQYLKFCVVRNPYDKAVSAYFFFQARDGRPVDAATDSRAFEEWLEQPGPPQDTDKFLIDGQFCLDRVLRYETLNQDLQRLCQNLGLPWQPDRLPTFKSGIRPRGVDLAALYTPRAKAAVQQAYAFELDYFGYDFPA